MSVNATIADVLAGRAQWCVEVGDCLALLPTLPVGAVDAVVTDPPASISFMGKQWDSDRGGRTQWTEWLTGALRECLRCLKPGGYALVWAIPRRSHWTAIALEDAGFHIVDRIAHLFGSGFPKGQGQLKPACEDWWLCRRPGPRVLPLGVDECRVPAPEGLTSGGCKPSPSNIYAQDKWTRENWKGEEHLQEHPNGRWPANVVHDGSEEVLELFPEQSDGGYPARRTPNKLRNTYGNFKDEAACEVKIGASSGSSARFFYCAKASPGERGEGNTHPTVKPLLLMHWLVRLVTPPSGLCLDPFAGSGTTALACLRTDRRCLLIEREPEYVEIIRRRVAALDALAPLFANGADAPAPVAGEPLTLFAEEM